MRDVANVMRYKLHIKLGDTEYVKILHDWFFITEPKKFDGKDCATYERTNDYNFIDSRLEELLKIKLREQKLKRILNEVD